MARFKEFVARYNGQCAACGDAVQRFSWNYQTGCRTHPSASQSDDEALHTVVWNPDTKDVWHYGCFVRANPLTDNKIYTGRSGQTCRGWSTGASWGHCSRGGRVRNGQPVVYTPTGRPVHVSNLCSGHWNGRDYD